MELQIEVFFHSDETLKCEDNDVEYSVLECDTRVMTFYFINSISPYLDEPSGEKKCRIYTGGYSFITTQPYEEIKELIHEHLKIKS